MASYFSPGELCCANTACVMIERICGSGPTWDLIPHVTNISTNSTVNTPKLVTSSTGGRETSLCGTITESGTLSVACHGGTGPGFLIPNYIYHLRWSPLCSTIWDYEACAPVAVPSMHLEAYIRITALPINYNISGNQGIVYDYGFDIISWVVSPETYAQLGCSGVSEGFVHCDS